MLRCFFFWQLVFWHIVILISGHKPKNIWLGCTQAGKEKWMMMDATWPARERALSGSYSLGWLCCMWDPRFVFLSFLSDDDICHCTNLPLPFKWTPLRDRWGKSMPVRAAIRSPPLTHLLFFFYSGSKCTWSSPATTAACIRYGHMYVGKCIDLLYVTP